MTRRIRAFAGTFALGASVAVGCGYAPTLRQRAAGESFCVKASLSVVGDAQAQSALESGVRQALGRAGALADCSRARGVTVVLRELQTMPEGIVAEADRPVARAVRVVAVAEARLDGEEVMQVEAEVTVASLNEVAATSQTHADARAQAARRAGERVGRRLVGEPSPGP
jgi:hypothetical protein